MFSKRKFKQMRPPPPPTLSKEYSRVWIGWCMIGDREVAREAAAKGIYIQLALQFIATRKEWDHSDVERWFKSEILSWVYQLVEQRQIFKASHILQNIGIDSTEQLSITLTETTNKNMRDYIAEHLQNNGHLETSLLNSWRLILAVEKSNILLNNSDDVSQLSIQKIDHKSEEWKSNIAAGLFFNSFDFHLESFLTPEASWDELLSHEKLDILKLWINIYFSKDLNYNCSTSLFPEIYLKLKNMFLVWEITNCMINQVQVKPYENIVKDFVLNELSNFGIFIDDEKHDVSKILSRFCKKQNIQNIFNILGEPSSYLKITEFYEKLNQYCVTNELFEVLSVCSSDFSSLASNSKQLSLWLRKNDSKDSKITEEVLNKHLVTALNYFSDDTNLYLENPIILIAIILFSKDTTFYDIIVNKSALSFDNTTISSQKIVSYLEKLPVFNNVVTKFVSTIPEDHNLYELLKNHSDFINAFEFRNKFIEMPHFGNKTLCEQYGYSESINYVYYIKQHRPIKAVKLFLLEQFRKFGKLNINESNTSDIILQLILRNTSNEMSSSCVAFLEMVGISTNDLRVVINAIDLIKSTHSQNEVEELFIKFKSNAQFILNLLEDVVLSKYDITENNFLKILKDSELVINFAKITNLEFPEKFLQHCVENNLWLQFIIYIQTYNYPVEQSLKLSMHFKNKQILEHIYHSLSTDIDPDTDQSFSSSLLSTSVTSYDFETESLSEFPVKSNLLKVLIKCHKSEDPPSSLLQACLVYKMPMLAILATCYEPDSVVTNWLTWLSISTNIELNLVENCSVNPNAVSDFLEEVLLKKYIRTLCDSFEIFLPENPLFPLVQFLYNCVQLNFVSSSEHLKSLEKSITSLNYNTVLISNDFEYTYLSNSYWLINTALKLIFAVLGSCFQSKQSQIKFLNYLCTADFVKNVPIDYPNFCAISKLLQSLSSNITINLSMFLDLDKRREEIIKCIEELVNNKQYKDALELAKYENICKEYILNEEWSNKYKLQPTRDFFIECNNAFESANILPSSAAEFYVYCCINLSENSEKYAALKLAYTWLKKSNYSDHFVENIEQEIWSNYFALDDVTLKGSYYEKHETNYLLSEIKQKTNTKSKFDQELNPEQRKHFEETIGKILESGDIIETLRLEKMFNQKFPETELLLTCYKLAEGKIKPYEITAEQRLIFLNRDMNLKSVPHRRRTGKSTRTSTGSYDSIQTVIHTIVEHEESTPEDTLTLLETLADRLKHGSNIASRILMCYRISVNVKQSYQDVVKCSNSEVLLKTALDNDCDNKLEVIHDVLVIFKWNTTQITDFILEELQKAIQHSINRNLDFIYMWNLDLDSQFHLVLQLCSETNSILGKKLIKIITELQEDQINSTVDTKEISMIIELLVRAHDCFNAYCNMEGIALVLRKAQTITSILLNFKHWKLMVRLLTGIGRYTEMNYIFQILKENDQFEFLLKRNFRQNNLLKAALLKFLRKHCPKNQDLYRIVALHFTLFSEVAELWENEANEMLDNLIEIAKLEVQNQGRNLDMDILLFTNNDSTKLCLNKAMTNYSHVAEYHLHGEKLISAMRAAKQAELIALQISLLKNVANNASTKCVLRLSSKQILEVASTELSFPQSKILAESYNHPMDWGAVLFQQCVINANQDYIEEFLSSKPLTNTLAQDLTRRFLAEKNVHPVSVKAMKDILKRLGSVHMKYRLASELGFGDVIETLLGGSQLDYLKDTVWKRGYKQL